MKRVLFLSVIAASLSAFGMISEKKSNHRSPKKSVKAASEMISEKKLNCRSPEKSVKAEEFSQLKLQKDLWKILKKKHFNTKKLRKLINSGLNINCRNNNGDTPILYAVRTHQNRLLEFLLKYPKVNIGALDLYGNTSVIIASKYKNIDMVRQLMNHIYYEKTDVLKFLYAYKNQQAWSDNQIQEYIDERKKSFINARNKSGITALHKATAHGNFELAEFLVENGADVNSLTTEGDIPLTIAIRGSNIKLAKYFIENGADINGISTEGTPLTLATKKCSKNFIKYLLNHGGDVNKIDSFGNTLLITAIKNKKERIIDLLIEYGAIINNEKGIQALNVAIELGFLKITKYLINRGIPLEQTDTEGRTPLDIAEEEGNQVLINFLRNQHLAPSESERLFNKL